MSHQSQSKQERRIEFSCPFYENGERVSERTFSMSEKDMEACALGETITARLDEIELITRLTAEKAEED